MKAVRYHAYGDPNHLQVEDIAQPTPGPGEALVRIHAAALNGFDPMILEQTTTLKNPLPMIPCGDGAGEVVGLGPDTDSALGVGARVSILPYGDHGMYGETALGLAKEFATVPVDNLVPIPDNVSFVDAAALPVAYGTAYRMMFRRGGVAGDDKVLILGAAGGVGTGCVQFAKSASAMVIAMASGEEKQRKLSALGADHVIDSRAEDFADQVKAIVGRPSYGGDGGLTMVINYIGGDTIGPCIKLLREGGRILTCGATAGYEASVDLRYMWSRELSLIGSDGWTKDDQAEILRMTSEATLRPVIHAVRPFSDSPIAMREMMDRQVFGKSILVPDGMES